MEYLLARWETKKEEKDDDCGVRSSTGELRFDIFLKQILSLSYSTWSRTYRIH